MTRSGLVLAAMVFGANAWLGLILWIRRDERRRELSADDHGMAWIADPRVWAEFKEMVLCLKVQPLGLLSVTHWYSRAFAGHPPMARRLARIAQVPPPQS